MSISFVKTKTTQSPKQYVLGTTVDIETVLSRELVSGETVNIRIQDADYTVKIDETESGSSMSNVTNKVYQYSWQTVVGGVTDIVGWYTAFIFVKDSAGHTYIDTVYFEMIDLMEDEE